MKTYPAKFVEWLLQFAKMDYEETETTIERKWEIMIEDHVIDLLTTKEAYKFWLKNKQQYK